MREGLRRRAVLRARVRRGEGPERGRATEGPHRASGGRRRGLRVRPRPRGRLGRPRREARADPDRRGGMAQRDRRVVRPFLEDVGVGVGHDEVRERRARRVRAGLGREAVLRGRPHRRPRGEPRSRDHRGVQREPAAHGDPRLPRHGRREPRPLVATVRAARRPPVTAAMRRLALPLAFALVALTVMALGPPARGAGPTYVSGEVVGSWTANGTPYIVTGEAFVPATGSLEIGPGVEVRFAAGASLVIHGGLTVRGSDLGPVAFTSNGSATPGAWGGLIVRGSAAIASASIAYATSGVDVEGGSVQGDRLAVLSSRVGLRVNGSSSVVVGRSSFSLNEIAGVSLESAQVAMVRPELSNNGWALSLVSSELTIDNGTISGSAIGDADLAGSRVSLLNTTSSHLFQFHDIDSNVTERWYAHVRVADTFGSPVPMASVAVSGDALPVPLLRATNPEGWAHWIDLAGRVTSTTGSIVPVYGVTAEARGSMASRTSTVVGDTLIPIALPADLTAPVAIAGPDLSATEDLTVSLDASRSTDNDPAFPLGATFTWRFDDAGTAQTLTGRTVPYVFATPGTYSVLLEVTDAAGNPGTDLLLVHVADVTLPVPRIAVPPEAYAGDTIVLDGLASTDNDPSFNETGNFTWTLPSESGTPGGTRRSRRPRSASSLGPPSTSCGSRRRSRRGSRPSGSPGRSGGRWRS
ncbi:MAG: PKD domain-containing protein [Methanobacteriota archaeon]|nr:MAG: PKD domain-containing protein [Euryarchaeota archaeon]